MQTISLETQSLLRLTLTPGIGPINSRKLIHHLGSPDAVLAASRDQLEKIPGIGPKRAAAIASTKKTDSQVKKELQLASNLSVHIVSLDDPAYPPLLRELPDAPLILYIKGEPDFTTQDRFPVAIVGSRKCSAYGFEQAQRFASSLATRGITIISGGARGIDSASHLAALNSQGRTIAVMGCGLAVCYPPENQPLYDRICDNNQGAIVSELPLNTEPDAKNFPGRNRLISGISLGVLVIEAAIRSGALITARIAVEDHGRDVMALPARVDNPCAQGSLDLLKQGAAALVTEPADVINQLEAPAHHTHLGTHPSRYAITSPAPLSHAGLNSLQIAILDQLDKPRTIDELASSLDQPAGKLRSQTTILEIRRLLIRKGPHLQKA